MSDTENASPAGESESFSASEPLNLSAAASMLDDVEREEQNETSQLEPEASEPPAETGSDDDGEGNDDQTDEPEGDEGEAGDDNSPDDDGSVEFDKLHGNTKVRLRDGTEWTVGELKRRIDDLRGLDDHRQQFAQQQHEFQQWAAQAAQQAQFFEQVAPQAIAAIQAQLPAIPDMPDRSLRDTDPFLYSAMVDDRNRAIEEYNGKVAQIQEIEQGQQLRQQEQTQAQQRAHGEFLRHQQEQLHAKMPELRDAAKREEFQRDLFKYGVEAYGFQPGELGNAYDHRLMMMARDAIAYRKLQTAKPKPVQAQPKPRVPVSQPGRRVTGGEAQANRREELTSRIHKPGGLSMSEAASLLDELG